MRKQFIILMVWIVMCIPLWAEQQSKASTAKSFGVLYTSQDFCLFIPHGWREFPFGEQFQLYLNGDGISFPPVDETGSPLRVGLTVEKFTDKSRSLDEHITALMKSVENNPRFELIGQETIESFTLSDGTPAKLLIIELITEQSRRSLYMKMVVEDSHNVEWVAGTFLIGGKESKIPTKNHIITLWLKAFLRSFSFDCSKVDEKAFSQEIQSLISKDSHAEEEH